MKIFVYLFTEIFDVVNYTGWSTKIAARTIDAFVFNSIFCILYFELIN